MGLEENGPKPSSALEIAMWRGGIDESLKTLKEFARDIDHSVTTLTASMDTKINGLHDKFNDIKYTVTKLVVWGGVALFVVNIIVAIAVGVAIKVITKGL